jgi:hypothetical protein
LLGIVLCALAAAACGDGGNTSTVSGTVYSWEETPPDTPPIAVAGVTVAVFGEPISDTTDANGRFTLQNVPNGDVFFTTTANGYWGYVDYYTVPGQTVGGINLVVAPDAEIADWEAALERTAGAVDILYYSGAQGGETGTISAPSDAAFTFVGWDPVEQDTVIADPDGFGELVFSSVNPADGPITATVMGAPGTTRCLVDETPGTEYPIIAKSLTIVYAWCEPVP